MTKTCTCFQTTTILQGSLDTQLFPLIEAILTQDKEDLIPYALQLIGNFKSFHNIFKAYNSTIFLQSPVFVGDPFSYFSTLPIR